MNLIQTILTELAANTKPPETVSQNGVPETSMATLMYLLSAFTFGSLSALAALLGDASRILTGRVIFAYIISGGLASMGLILLLIEKYGFSYFLVGVAVFAGYKAFDILAVISLTITKIAKKLYGPDLKND